ncbi:MAG TPA: helix-turn-helix domain-containing protein [Bacteroidia bacterium]|nr:helix-turn-helix domain-containing protein [Bacteroidia bacterium]
MEDTSLKYLGIFFLIAAAQGFFFAFSQLSLKAKLNRPRFFLALIIFFFSLSLVESGMWWSGWIDKFVHIIFISDPLPFLFGPLIYFYFKSSFLDFRFNKKQLLHLFPFFLYFIYCSQFYFNSTESKAAMMNDEIGFNDFFSFYIKSTYVTILMTLSLSVYCVFTWKHFFYKTNQLKEIRTWFLLSFGVFTFYVLSYSSFHVMIRYHIMSGCADYGIASSIAIFIYLFSWFGFARPKIFDGYSVTEVLRPALEPKYRSSVLTQCLEKELGERLNELMTHEKLYKTEEIGLDLLAQRLGVSRNSISQVINQTGMNFFEYINHWRIEEAKKILSQTSKSEFNIIEVAYEVGFNNKVSFNKFFKKSTGLTPTEYRKLAVERKS